MATVLVFLENGSFRRRRHDKVMVVYDEDPLYAGRLAEYVNQKETFPFQAMAFSDLEN